MDTGRTGTLGLDLSQSLREALHRSVAVLAGLLCGYAHATPGAPGTLDLTWSTDGITSIDVTGSTQSIGLAMAQQRDGKVLQTGYCSIASRLTICTVRYNADGSIDTTFGASGFVTSLIAPATNNVGTAIAVQPDGKIVVGARCTWTTSNGDYCAIRYLPSGAVDNGFGTNGSIVTPIASVNDQARALALQADGKIVLTGFCRETTHDRFCTVRYTANGQLDASFGTGGIVQTSLVDDSGAVGQDQAYAVSVQPDGKIIVAGVCTVTVGADFCAIRYNNNGTPDATFGANGIAIHSLTAARDTVYAIALQDDGKIVLAGQCSGTANVCLARLQTNGQLDTSFNLSGFRVVSASGSNGAFGVAIQPNGTIAVGGSCAGDFCLMRFAPDGTAILPVTTTAISTGFGLDESTAILLQPDGKFVLGGNCNSSNEDYCTARYDGEPPKCLDLDGDGLLTATVDSLMFSRIERGMTGDPVTASITFPAAALRTTYAAINTHLTTQCSLAAACDLDLDGDGVVNDSIDAILHSRIASGMTGDAVTSGLSFATAASRKTWPLIRAHLRSQCNALLS